MTSKLSLLTKKPPHSGLSTMAGNTRPLQPAAVNTTVAGGQHSTQSAETGDTLNIMQTSPVNTSSRISSAEIAATLFRSTLLALLAAGLVKRGHTADGSIAIVLSRQHWSTDLKLTSTDEVIK